MALMKQPEAAQKQAPQFEQPEGETAGVGPKVTEAEMATAGVEATKAVAKAATTSVGAAIKFQPAFAHCDNAIPIEQVEMWGQAPSAITAEQGVAKHSKKGSLGGKFHLLVESFNQRFLAVPGVNDKEAKEKVRNSYNKLTIAGTDESFPAYIESLKAEGYDKAHYEPYVDLWGYVTWSEKGGVVGEDDQELVRVQLSKTSSANFGFFCGQRGRRESNGSLPKLDTIEITAEAQDGKSGSYTNFSFAAPKAK